MKQMGKVTILMVAVIAIGIFALPSIMAVGTGQHKFINATSIRGGDTSKNCLKCHGTASDDVKGELDASDTNYVYRTPGVTVIHSSIQCANCHKEAVGAGTHTKVTRNPNCIDCHVGGTIQTPVGPITLQPVWTELNNATEPHLGFRDVNNPNAGCMGCHTAVSVTGEVSYTYSAGFTQLGLTIGNTTVSKPIVKP